MANAEIDDRGVITSCPSCQQRNRVPYGRAGKCKKCGAALPALAEPVEVPSTHVFDALIDVWSAHPESICVSSYAGQRGNPVLFPRRFFGELLELTGDVGGRDVIRQHPDAVLEVPMPDPEAARDVDTWEDYLAAQRLAGG